MWWVCADVMCCQRGSRYPAVIEHPLSPLPPLSKGSLREACLAVAQWDLATSTNGCGGGWWVTRPALHACTISLAQLNGCCHISGIRNALVLLRRQVLPTSVLEDPFNICQVEFYWTFLAKSSLGSYICPDFSSEHTYMIPSITQPCSGML